MRVALAIFLAIICGLQVAAQTSSEERQLRNTAPLDWMGKAPDAPHQGRSFFDLIYLNDGPFPLGLSQTQSEASFSQIIEGCTFTRVRPAAFDNPIPFIGGGQQKLFFYTIATCADGREMAVLTYSFIMGINMTDPDEREVVWPGQFCISHPKETSVTTCSVAKDNRGCTTAPKPTGFSCTADIGETWRQTRFMREAAVTSEYRCEKVWNPCANPVARPPGSAFSPCFGAGGAFETVCSGGSNTARLQSPSVPIDLPDFVARRWDALKSACDEADANGLVEIPDAGGGTRRVPCAQIDEMRQASAARDAAQKAAFEAELAAARAAREKRDAEERLKEEDERRAAEEEYQRLLSTPPDQLLRESGFAQFALRPYLPKSLKVRGVGDTNVVVTEMYSITADSTMEGYYTLAVGADLEGGEDFCSLVVRKAGGAPDMATAIRTSQPKCRVEDLGLSATEDGLVATFRHRDQTYRAELTPAPVDGEPMAFPLPDSWEQISGAMKGDAG